MDGNDQVRLLGQVPKGTLAYFVHDITREEVSVLLKKETIELQRQIVAHGKAEVVLHLCEEADGFINLHKDEFLYFMRKKSEKAWQAVPFSRVQYVLENCQGQFGKALLYCLLSFKEASSDEYQFKAEPKVIH